ncbi:hypothetical protein AC1031_011442 [Aphanomyces cochlioides]|nr:hypothetical protein AC1031_011442 [Aphanomyces cochlioides]
MKSQFICEYVGEIISAENAKALQQKNRDIYLYDLKNGFSIDACRNGNIARFINHSCRSNTFFDEWYVNGYKRIVVVARRNIKKNKELTVNYGPAYQFTKCLCDFCKKKRAVAVAEPIEALEPVDAQAPLEVQEATGAQEPLEVPETDVAQAQFEALEAVDAQATAEVPEVGAQAPLEVPEVVDVTAQEVADEQATANVDTTAGDDDHAAAPLDAACPTQ